MKKSRIVGLVLVLIGVCLVTVDQLTSLNFSDLSWTKNSSNYLRLISIVFIAIGVLIANFTQNKKQK